MTRRRALTAAVCSAAFLALAGCGSGGSGSDTSGQIHGGTHMSGMHMSPGIGMSGHQVPAGVNAPASDASSSRPSASASMVCDHEIHIAIERTFEQPSLELGVSTYQNRLFTCTYALPGGPLVLSVKDSPAGPSGRADFNALRAADGMPRLLTGLEAFGLPSYETKDGRVVFLKDGKTLAVDAGALPEVAGPKGESRTDVAYAIAADVIGCWSE